MIDRELLELAAKAAGYALCEWPDEHGKLRAEIEPHWHPVWNPLTDDGDALRLAVKLQLHLEWWPGLGKVAACTAEKQTAEPYGTNPYAATRRAIVRAAAAIGRAMK
jgi:hypothetical protein